MSRVLVWKKITPGGEYDIYRKVSCTQEYMTSANNAFNVGNRLWFQGLMSSVDTGENQYDYLTDELTSEVINEEYDFILLPMANIFNERYLSGINYFSEVLTGIKIPVYVVACGAQADSYDMLESLICAIGEPSKRFINAVYETGGEFALRGYFTKEFFNKLGFNSAVVTGCPSMYQLGRSFQAVSPTEEMKCRPVAFNGQIEPLQLLIDQCPESIYLDQDVFWNPLYGELDTDLNFRVVLSNFCNYGSCAVRLLGQNRVRLIPDMYNWRTYLKENGFGYSFGTRIHGNIMAVLSGIPATVVAVDSRTREMAEFFHIPNQIHIPGHIYTLKELERQYWEADYTEFNRAYQENYDRYADFLINHGIVSHINQNNGFFSAGNDYFPPMIAKNSLYYSDISEKIEKYRMLLDIAKSAVLMKNKLHK